jgi:hypothetical protein
MASSLVHGDGGSTAKADCRLAALRTVVRMLGKNARGILPIANGGGVPVTLLSERCRPVIGSADRYTLAMPN